MVQSERLPPFAQKGLILTKGNVDEKTPSIHWRQLAFLFSIIDGVAGRNKGNIDRAETISFSLNGQINNADLWGIAGHNPGEIENCSATSRIKLENPPDLICADPVNVGGIAGTSNGEVGHCLSKVNPNDYRLVIMTKANISTLIGNLTGGKASYCYSTWDQFCHFVCGDPIYYSGGEIIGKVKAADNITTPITEKASDAIIEECWYSVGIIPEYQYEEASLDHSYEGVIDLVGQNNGTKRPADLTFEEVLDSLGFDWTIWDKESLIEGFPTFL